MCGDSGEWVGRAKRRNEDKEEKEVSGWYIEDGL